MFQAYTGRYLDDRSAAIVDTVATVAGELGVPPLAVALAWVRDRPGVSCALIGARNIDQLRQSLAPETDNLLLPEQAVRTLDEVSKPHRGYPETGV